MSTPEPVTATTRPAPDSETRQVPSAPNATPTGWFSPEARVATSPLRTDTTRPAPSSAATTLPSGATATP